MAIKLVRVTDDQETVRKRLNEIVQAINSPATGLPAGGATGQVLAKASTVDFDVEWVPAGGGGGGGGGASWGSITGTLSSQTDLQTALNGKANSSHNHSISNVVGLQTALDSKQETLVSATNIKTINGVSVLGSGDLTVSSSPTMLEATVDFGAFGYTAVVAVPDATVTASTKLSYGLTVTGRDADELEMAPIVMSHVVNDGVGITFYANALQGADGQFKINYMKA